MGESLRYITVDDPGGRFVLVVQLDGGGAAVTLPGRVGAAHVLYALRGLADRLEEGLRVRAGLEAYDHPPVVSHTPPEPGHDPDREQSAGQ